MVNFGIAGPDPIALAQIERTLPTVDKDNSVLTKPSFANTQYVLAKTIMGAAFVR